MVGTVIEDGARGSAEVPIWAQATAEVTVSRSVQTRRLMVATMFFWCFALMQGRNADPQAFDSVY